MIQRTNSRWAASSQMYLDNEIANTVIPKKGSKRGMTKLQRMNIIIGTDAENKPIYKKISGHTQAELADNVVIEYVRSGRIKEFITAADLATITDTPTVNEYAMRVLEVFKRPKLKPGTYEHYKKTLNYYILPYVGDKMVHTITAADVQEMLNAQKELSRSTLNEALTFLGQVLDYAIEEYKLTMDNPCKSKFVDVPSKKVHKREALPHEHFVDIENNLYKLNPEDALLLAIPMYTGLRKGETLGLRWEDVDMDKRLIHIRRSVTYPTGTQPHIDTPKTSAGNRDVYLGDNLLKYMDIPHGDGFVFGGDKPVTACHYNNTWERINKAIDLHGATLHVLRHTFITYASTETDMKTLQSVAGHSTITMTMDRYSHPQEHKIIELGRRMDNNIFKHHGHDLDTELKAGTP